MQFLADQFWRRWSREYLRTIIARQKWCKRKKNFAVDDVILVVDNATHRSQWSIGRITATHPEQHGFVRQVSVKTKGAQLRRPIHKLCLIVPNDADKTEDDQSVITNNPDDNHTTTSKQ